MKVIVKYINDETKEEMKEIVIVEKDGKIELEEKDSIETIEGLEGDKYETKGKKFKNYVLKEVPENAKGEMISTEGNEIYVMYYYEKAKAKVTVKCINEKTGEVLENEKEIEGEAGDKYETKPEEIEGFDLIEEKYPENAEGEMEEETEVVYYYVRRMKVVTNYLDKYTKEKLDEGEIQEGHEGTEYETEEKAFERYALRET